MSFSDMKMEREHKFQAPEQPSEQDDGVFFVVLNYKGVAYSVPVQAGDAIDSIFGFVQEVLQFPRENCKLICRGKVFRPNDEVQTFGSARLAPGSNLMLIASSAHDVAFVQQSRADPLVKGFAEEERDERNRQKRARTAQQSAWGTKQDPQFCFASIKAEFKYNQPSPYEAEALLKKLATDPGVIEIMKTRNFKVGILTEMSPAEAQDRMAKRGTPNMDLLGYNQNAGDMIVLRLRTDNTKGFRPYHDLMNTLLHELTHNVWGPHDHNFWKLYGELKAQYMRFHRFWSHGGRSADSSAGAQFGGFSGGDDDTDEARGGGGGSVKILGGGDVSVMSADGRRRRALEAAESRAATGVPKSLPTVDFLNSGGGWLQVCACGQVHGNDVCPSGMATAEEQPADQEPQQMPVAATAPDILTASPAPSAEARNESSSILGATTEDIEVASIPALLDENNHLAEVDNEKQQLGIDVLARGAALPDDADRQYSQSCEVGDCPVKPVSPGSSERRAASDDSFVEGTLDSPELDDDCSNLDLAELEALGLDGSAVWLHRFAGQLEALCRAGRPDEARRALALLLTLAKNVLGNPSDAKFRKIRANNPKIQSALMSAGAEAVTLITMLGFESMAEAGERVFLLRDATLDIARLRLGKELLERRLGLIPVAAR